MKPKLRPNTPEEEAAIQRGIAQDPENPEWTEADFAAARPANDQVPALVEARLRRGRGKQKAPTKVLVTLRLDQEVLASLRRSGRGWQTRANRILREQTLGPAPLRKPGPVKV